MKLCVFTPCLYALPLLCRAGDYNRANVGMKEVHQETGSTQNCTGAADWVVKTGDGVIQELCSRLNGYFSQRDNKPKNFLVLDAIEPFE